MLPGHQLARGARTLAGSPQGVLGAVAARAIAGVVRRRGAERRAVAAPRGELREQLAVEVKLVRAPTENSSAGPRQPSPCAAP